jgi:hypothetical protein
MSDKIDLPPDEMSMGSERAAFEGMHASKHPQLLTRYGDTYTNAHVRCRWEGWQARADWHYREVDGELRVHFDGALT